VLVKLRKGFSGLGGKELHPNKLLFLLASLSSSQYTPGNKAFYSTIGGKKWLRNP